MINLGIAIFVLIIFYVIREKYFIRFREIPGYEGFTNNVYRYQQYKEYLPYSIATNKNKPTGTAYNVYQYWDMTEEKLKNSVDPNIYRLSEQSNSHGLCKEECSKLSDCNWFHFEKQNKKCYLGDKNSILGGEYTDIKNKKIVGQW